MPHQAERKTVFSCHIITLIFISHLSDNTMSMVLVAQPGVSNNTSTLACLSSKLSETTQVPRISVSIPQPPVGQCVGSTYTYSSKSTSISVGCYLHHCQRILTFGISHQFPWPTEVTGLERIVLSAKGDLQRLLRYVVQFLPFSSSTITFFYQRLLCTSYHSHYRLFQHVLPPYESRAFYSSDVAQSRRNRLCLSPMPHHTNAASPSPMLQ